MRPAIRDDTTEIGAPVSIANHSAGPPSIADRKLTDAELSDLVAFLRGLDCGGKLERRNFRKYNGPHVFVERPLRRGQFAGTALLAAWHSPGKRAVARRRILLGRTPRRPAPVATTALDLDTWQ
jgi:hypothetical protein